MEFPKLSLVPIYLEAPNREELIQLMVANNTINSQAFNYFEPRKVGKKWTVWFYADITNWRKPDMKLADVSVDPKNTEEVR